MSSNEDTDSEATEGATFFEEDEDNDSGEDASRVASRFVTLLAVEDIPSDVVGREPASDGAERVWLLLCELLPKPSFHLDDFFEIDVGVVGVARVLAGVDVTVAALDVLRTGGAGLSKEMVRREVAEEDPD